MLMAPFEKPEATRRARPRFPLQDDAVNDDTRADLVVRMAIIGEAGSSTLLIWSELLHNDISVCRTSENYLADISPNRFDYDVLIIAGNDSKRIKRLLRYYAAALALKPKIALTRMSSPSERATLRIPRSSRAAFRFDRARHSEVIARSVPRIVRAGFRDDRAQFEVWAA